MVSTFPHHTLHTHTHTHEASPLRKGLGEELLYALLPFAFSETNFLL
jgi:hypothetical protein